MPHRHVSPQARDFARALRTEQTEAERKLWRILRGRRFAGLKWRRQVPLGRYILDFVCFEHHVVVECDGAQHAESLGDEIRDAWLAAQGFAVVRFWNHDIMHSPRMVEDTILARAGLPV